MIRYPIHAGESLFEAIVMASYLAGRENTKWKGYVVVCPKCNEPISDHQHSGDCEIFQRNRRLA